MPTFRPDDNEIRAISAFVAIRRERPAPQEPGAAEG
jgi:hypothetical protein